MLTEPESCLCGSEVFSAGFPGLVHGAGPHPALKDLLVPGLGRLLRTGDPWGPYRLLGPDGECVAPAMEFLADLQAAGGPAATLRSYGMDLLRWWRPVNCTMS